MIENNNGLLHYLVTNKEMKMRGRLVLVGGLRFMVVRGGKSCIGIGTIKAGALALESNSRVPF